MHLFKIRLPNCSIRTSDTSKSIDTLIVKLELEFFHILTSVANQHSWYFTKTTRIDYHLSLHQHHLHSRQLRPLQVLKQLRHFINSFPLKPRSYFISIAKRLPNKDLIL